jgi:predicted secreted hydrolase
MSGSRDMIRSSGTPIRGQSWIEVGWGGSTSSRDPDGTDGIAPEMCDKRVLQVRHTFQKLHRKQFNIANRSVEDQKLL